MGSELRPSTSVRTRTTAAALKRRALIDTELVDAFARTRSNLVAAARRVPEEQRDEPFVGIWDIKDLLAHLAGWDRTNLDALQDFPAGRRPAFYDHYDPGWATYNAQLVARYRLDDFEALLELLGASQKDVVAGLRALPGAELTRERALGRTGRPLSIAGLLRAAIHDEAQHLRQIEGFLAHTR